MSSEYSAPESTNIPKDSEQRVKSLLGAMIDNKYQVEEHIGRGGIGMVYKAKHVLIGREVAIKVLHPHLIENEDSLKRFQHEAQVASKLNHPNAVLIYDYGVFKGAPFIVMEYVKGLTLKDKIKTSGAISPAKTYEFFSKACAALKEAHSLGIVHRDLKPDNIIISQKDGGVEHVQVLDFGIAKLLTDSGEKGATIVTQAGMFYGTPHYASPEQALGKELDKRSDIYSLGIILFECLAGEVPFDAPSIMEVLMQQINKEPPALSERQPKLRAHAQLDAVIKKSLAKDPAERYQSVDELLDAFKAAISNTRAHGGAEIPQAKTQSSAAKLFFGAMVLSLGVVGGGLFYKLSTPEEKLEVALTDTSSNRVTNEAAAKEQDVASPVEEPAAEGPASDNQTAQVEKENEISTEQESLANQTPNDEVVHDQSDDTTAEVVAMNDEVSNEETHAENEAQENKAQENKDSNAIENSEPSAETSSASQTEEEVVATVEQPAKQLTVKEIARLFREGETYYRQKKYPEAISKLEQAVAANPAFVKARLSLGNCYLRLKRMSEAFSQFSTALRADPTYPPTHFNLACYHALTNNADKALESLKLAIEYEPAARRWARSEPDLANIKSDERFKQLVR